jgi:hypothetical protein
MTTMRPHVDPPGFDAEDQNTVQAHKASVITEYKPLFDLIEQALRDSASQARDFFLLVDGPVDLSVHAAWTRYLCKRHLASQSVFAEDEEDSSFEMGKIPNCGLCLNGSRSQIRILKATVNGVPKATSDARSRFYCSNQYLLPFDAPKGSILPAETPLSLIVLWSLDSEFQFKGMEIACPKKEREDGSVECHWIEDWQGARVSASIAQISPTPLGADLDEIKPLPQNKKAKS